MTWKAPRSDGGALITGYVVERREGLRPAWKRVGETSSETLRYKATRLTEGSEYVFRVAAENAIGVGDFAATDKPVKADVPFGQLRSLRFHTRLVWYGKCRFIKRYFHESLQCAEHASIWRKARFSGPV